MLGLSPAAQISPAPIPRDPTATSRHGTQAGTEARARDAQGFLGSSLGLVSHKLSQQTAKPAKYPKAAKIIKQSQKSFWRATYLRIWGPWKSSEVCIAPGLKSRRSPGPQGWSDAPGGARCSAGEFGGSMEGCSWTLLVPQPPEL